MPNTASRKNRQLAYQRSSPCPSVLRDKSLAEMVEKVSVVKAADYSYLWGVRGDCVAQALIVYKTMKLSLPGNVYIWRAFPGEFWYSTRGTYGKLCPKPPPVLTPRVHMEPIVGAAVPRRSAEPPPPCSSKDGPSGLSLRSLSNIASFSAASASFSFCILSKSALRAAISSDTDISLSLAYCPSPSALSQLYSPSLFRSPMATVPASPNSLYPSPLAVPVPS